MLTTLERRGYIRRDPLTGAYGLTLRLFELSHTHSPLQGSRRAAASPMRTLTETIRESRHLSVIEREHLVVLVQEESPARVRLSVEIGCAFPLLHTVSGRVLLAHLDEPARADLLAREGELARLPATDQLALHERVRLICARLRHVAQRDNRGGERPGGAGGQGDLARPSGADGRLANAPARYICRRHTAGPTALRGGDRARRRHCVACGANSSRTRKLRSRTVSI